MSTQNNTLTDSNISKERKEECEAELTQTSKIPSFGSDDDSDSPLEPIIDEEQEAVEESKQEPSEESKEGPSEESKEEPKDPDAKTEVNSIPQTMPTPAQMTYKPNTLTILINTKIRNHRMLYYKPYMTVPGEVSRHVCFDPLVLLNQSVVNKIPENQPADELYTQFYRRNEFNSLLKRTLAQSMQPIYTFEEARKDGVTDTNVKVTLDTLFKEGNQFFIGGQSYIINSYDWIQGDWEIDTRPNYQQQVRFLPYGVAYPKNYVYNFGRQAKRERDTIPPEAIKGDALQSTSKLKKAIESATSNIFVQPGIKASNNVEVKKYTIPNIAELVELKETDPEKVLNLDREEENEAEPIPLPEEEITEEGTKPELPVSVEQGVEKIDPTPTNQPAVLEDPDKKILEDDVPEKVEIPQEVSSDDDESSEFSDLSDVSELPEDSTSQILKPPPAIVTPERPEPSNESTEEVSKEETKKGTLVEQASTLPPDIAKLIMAFAEKRKLPGEDLSQQFERYLLQEASRDFFSQEAVLDIVSVEKTKDDEFEVVSLTPGEKGVKNQLEAWDVEENDGKGDCLFEAIAQIQGEGNTVHSVRRALADYFKGEGQGQFKLMKETVSTDLPNLVKRQDSGETLSDYEKETIMNYKFMLNEDNTDFLSDEEIIEIIEIPVFEKNRDSEVEINEKFANRSPDKYFLGEQNTLISLEQVFNTKFVIIEKKSKNTVEEIQLNSRVEWNEDGETRFGTVSMEDKDTSMMKVITDDYKEYEKPITELKIVKLYTIRKNPSNLEPNKDIKAAFLLFRFDGSANSHYEAVFKRGITGRQKEIKTYKFALNLIPSYLVYMIYLSVYGFNKVGRLEKKAVQSTDPDPVFEENKKAKDDKDISNFLAKKLRQINAIYKDRLEGTEIAKPQYIDVQFGGQVKPYVTTYLQNSMNVDTKNTYYIVVDLDLYPGTALTSGQKYRLSCAANYDRMRSAWADIFGLQYEPGELDVSSVQSPMETVKAEAESSAPPMAEAEVIPANKSGGGYTHTKKKQHKPSFTRRIYTKSNNKKTRMKGKKRKNKTTRNK